MVDVFFEARILGYDCDCLEQCGMGEEKKSAWNRRATM